MTQLKWSAHGDLAIRKTPSVGREEYLDYMTFRRNERPLFTELFGPLVGLKEEWEAQGATPEELDFSAFQYRCEASGFIPIKTGRDGGFPEMPLEETDEHKIWRDGLGGGCVLGLDHRIPGGTSLDNYKFYVGKAWEIMNRESEIKTPPSRLCDQKGTG